MESKQFGLGGDWDLETGDKESRKESWGYAVMNLEVKLKGSYGIGGLPKIDELRPKSWGIKD